MRYAIKIRNTYCKEPTGEIARKDLYYHNDRPTPQDPPGHFRPLDKNSPKELKFYKLKANAKRNMDRISATWPSHWRQRFEVAEIPPDRHEDCPLFSLAKARHESC